MIIRLVTEAGYQEIRGVVGLQHLSAIGLDHQQRFGMRHARRNDRECCDDNGQFNGKRETRAEENALSDSGPLRPAFEEEVLTCDVRVSSVSGAVGYGGANLYNAGPGKSLCD